jgi:two-component system, sensor histidine kinase and response regulator
MAGAPQQLSPTGVRPAEILIVEDDEIVGLELQKRLKELGYKVVPDRASTGEQALQFIEQRSPDLVLMDIVLAGEMSGTQTARLIRKRFQTPVVYLTAYTDAATLQQMKETGGHGFVAKPFRPQELHGVIQLALSQYEKEQQQRRAERNAWQEICRRSQDQLQQFTYTAGHDLREPLRTAKGFIDLLAKRSYSKLDEEERELLSEAQAGLRRMDTLLQDLLGYAQAGLAQGVPVSTTPADAALRWALENLRSAIVESGARITHDALPHVRADPSQLSQVFQNLLGNAIKYRRLNTEPHIHVTVEKREGEWLFTVSDNGIGFDPQQSERIFALFKRLHSYQTYPGSGLGLAICKKIIETHGGRIWAEAAPDQGSMFFFTLADGGSQPMTQEPDSFPPGTPESASSL